MPDFTEPQLKWLNALRSGEYQQGREALAVKDEEGNKSFCCLGIACDLYIKEHPSEMWWVDPNPAEPSAMKARWYGKGNWITSFLEEGTVLPDRVANWLDIKDLCGLYAWETSDLGDLTGQLASDLGDLTGQLISDNDKGLGFEKIADTIEKHANKLFKNFAEED